LKIKNERGCALGNKLYFPLIFLTWILLNILSLLLFSEPFAVIFLSLLATAVIWYGIPAIASWICGFLPYTYHEVRVVKFVDQSDEFWWHGVFHSRRNLRRGYVVTFEIIESGKKKRFFIPVEFGAVGLFDHGRLCMQDVCFRHFSRSHTKRPDNWHF